MGWSLSIKLNISLRCSWSLSEAQVKWGVGLELLPPHSGIHFHKLIGVDGGSGVEEGGEVGFGA